MKKIIKGIIPSKKIENATLSIEERQINMLKFVLENESATVFGYARQSKIDNNSALRTAEHLGKIGALEIGERRMEGDGNKFIWANLKTEKAIEDPRILNSESQFLIEINQGSFVVKGNNNSLSHVILSREKNEQPFTKMVSNHSVSSVELSITNDTVERAIQDAKLLIKENGATSGVDRIHTVLHGFLIEVCKKENITLSRDETLTQVFKKLKNSHAALKNLHPRQNDITQIFSSFSNILDKLNPIRNKASLAHPNKKLLEEDEAMFVIDSAQTILNYLNSKFKY